MAPAETDGGLTVGQRICQLETSVIGVIGRVDKLEAKFDRYDGRLDVIVTIGKWILGTSAFGLLVTVVTLYLLVTGGNAK